MSSYTFINSPLKRTQDGSNNSYVAHYSQISGLENRLETLIRENMNTYFFEMFRNNVIAKDPIYFGEENGRITIGCNSDSQPSSGTLSDIEIGNDAGLRTSRIPIMSNNGGLGNQTSWSVGTIYATLDNGSQIDISSNVNVTLHSSNTNIAYVTDDLKIISSGNVSGQTTITATYTYSYNGVTKTKTIQSTLTVYDLAINSIKWTSTSAVQANTGSKPNMGTITVIWNDNSSTTVSSTNSDVTLYINSTCTTPLNYNNAISNQSIWAKYNGKNTTNNKKLTLNAQSPTIESIAWSSVLSLDFTMNDANDYDFGDITINYSNGQQETITTHNNPNCKFVDSTNSELDLNRTYTKRPIWCVYTDSNNRPYVTTNSKYLTLSEPEPVISEIRWEETTSITSTVGSKPNMGRIRVIWSDNSEDSIGSYQGDVSLYTNSECTIPLDYNNAISNQSIWAKFQGKITTNSKKLTLSEPEPQITGIDWADKSDLNIVMNDDKLYDFGDIVVSWNNGTRETISTYNNPNCRFEDNWGSNLNLDIAYINQPIRCIWTNGDTGYRTLNWKNLNLTPPQSEEEYYFYVGTIEPPASTPYQYVEGWTQLSEKPSNGIKIFKDSPNYEDVQWYLAAPADWHYETSVNGHQVGGWTKTTQLINGVWYNVWAAKALTDRVNVTLANI